MGGLLVDYKPCYQPASQGAGFHLAQALLFLPLWIPLKELSCEGIFVFLRLIYPKLYLIFWSCMYFLIVDSLSQTVDT